MAAVQSAGKLPLLVKKTGPGCCVRNRRMERYTMGTSMKAKMEKQAA